MDSRSSGDQPMLAGRSVRTAEEAVDRGQCITAVLNRKRMGTQVRLSFRMMNAHSKSLNLKITTAPFPPSSRARSPRTPPPTLAMEPNCDRKNTEVRSCYEFELQCMSKHAASLECDDFRDWRETERAIRLCEHNDLLN